MTGPRVDVGIVTWNTRELTLQALERLLQSSGDVDLRVLVRDNGSSDGTADAIRERFPQVEVDVGDNVGFAAGVNALLARSEAPWFVTLNSDAWPEPGALRRLVAAGEAHPRAAVVAPLLLRPDGALEESAHPLPSLATAAVTGAGLERVLRRRWGLSGWGHDVERQVGWAVGAALLLRREAVAELGGLDASLFMYAEDLEWCWRARRAGWEVWFTPSAVVRHVGNASGEQRFGLDRDRVAITNANAIARRYLGRRAVLWQLLNALGALRWVARAGLGGDLALVRYWWRQVPAHLGRGAR